MKKILFAASECVPFIKTGGLADVCGALPKTFDHKDWDVRVVIPNYSCIPEKYRSQFEYVTHFYMACGSYIPSKYVGVLQYKLDGVTYYLKIHVLRQSGIVHASADRFPPGYHSLS